MSFEYLEHRRGYWFQGPGYQKLKELRQLWLEALGGDPADWQEYRGEQHVHAKIEELLRAIGELPDTNPPQQVEDEINVIWTDGVLITPMDTSANFTGEIDTYAITILPTGLTMDPATGIITGTPLGLSGGRSLVTATGPDGSAEFVLDWAVVAA